MTDVHDHICQILALPKVSVGDISRVLGVTFRKDRENPHWEFYESDRTGPFEEVLLNLAKPGPGWHVFVHYLEPWAPCENELDLDRYGIVKDIELNPRIPPEGTRTISYDYQGVYISFQFTTITKRLRAISIRQP